MAQSFWKRPQLVEGNPVRKFGHWSDPQPAAGPLLPIVGDPVGGRRRVLAAPERSTDADLTFGIGISEYDRDERHDSFRQGGTEGGEYGAGRGLCELEALTDPLHSTPFTKNSQDR